MSTHPHLLSPALWGPVPVRNRVFMPAMGMHMVDPGGTYSDQEIAYVAARARGGAGLLTTGCMPAQDAYEPAPEALVHATSDRAIPRMRDLTDAVHAHGAKVVAQLTAAFGRNAEPRHDTPFQPFSASAVPSFYRPDVLCRPLEVDEIHDLVALFGQAAARCIEAGFDGVDIHAHTGYLPDQFMSPEWNQRTDEYGGSLENRMRFPVELVRAARAAIGPEHAISFRLTVDQKIPGGRTVAETRQMAPILAAAGIDVLSLDVGSYDAMQWICPSYYAGDDPSAELFAAVSEVVDVQVAVAGNVTADAAEKAIAAGVYDFMGSGRALIADPDWPNKLAGGRAADIRPCIRCNEMCMGNVMAGQSVTCSVNPQAGREAATAIVEAGERKHLVVVGGGPAGLEAARVAALRGHRVEIFEKGSRLGGVLEPAARAEFKRQLHTMVDWWERQVDAAGVTVHLDTEVKAGAPELGAADEVLVATGAQARVPALPGLDLPHVVDVIDFHLGTVPAGERVVVCGGGLSGCDSALELARQGKKVTVVEMTDAVAPNLTYQTRLMLLEELAASGAVVLTGTTVRSVDAQAVTVSGPDGNLSLPADTVITAFGVAPCDALAAELVASGIDRSRVHVLGDALHPAKVGDAIHAGFDLGLAL